MSQERFQKPVSLNKDQNDIVERAKEINGASYATLLVLGAKEEIRRGKKKG